MESTVFTATDEYVALDSRLIWHPFTQMRDWLKTEPIVIAEGKGAVLRDVHGREYLDANASIWTNLHGHNHPKINAAIRRQLGKISHSSALGFANEPASLLAERLVRHANPGGIVRDAKARSLEKVFYSNTRPVVSVAAIGRYPPVNPLATARYSGCTPS